MISVRDILFSQRLDIDNPGDLWSCPKDYFFQGTPNQTLDVFDSVCDIGETPLRNPNTNCYITGGGNILVSNAWADYNENILARIKKYASAKKFKAVWGAGIDFDNNYVLNYLKNFDMVGTRVFKKKYPDSRYSFVPCVSVMNSLLDKEYERKYDVAIIPHFKIPLPVEVYTGKWRMSKQLVEITNKPATLDKMLTAIGESETVITSSYHATYWAMLMNKRVICHVTGVRDFVQRKLETFERKPTYIYEDGTFSPSLLTKLYNYSGMKEEYRELNTNFYNKVREQLANRDIL